jgi:hypothetical protein
MKIPLKINGWWRLWIVVAIVWSVTVASYTYFHWPNSAAAAHRPSFLSQLDREQRQSLANENETEPSFEVEMPNGHILHFRPNVEEKNAERVAGAYHDITVRAQNESKERMVRRSISMALLPSLALVLLGSSVAWIRRGFSQAVAN